MVSLSAKLMSVLALASTTLVFATVQNQLTAVFTSSGKAMAQVATLQAHPQGLSRVALYTYSLGKITSNFSLPPTPYGLEFTQAVKALNGSDIAVTPIINCGGENAEYNWKHSTVWNKVFTEEAVAHGYDGYVMDMEISHSAGTKTQEEFADFITGFGRALAAVNKTLQVITKYDFPKGHIVRAEFEGLLSYYYTSQESSLGYIRELTEKYPSKAGVLIEPKSSWNFAEFFTDVAAQQPYPCRHLGLWSDLQGLTGGFFDQARIWLNRTHNSTATNE